MTKKTLIVTTMVFGLTACPADDVADTGQGGSDSAASTSDATDSGQSSTSSDPTGQTSASGSASATSGTTSDDSASATSSASSTDGGSTDGGSTGDTGKTSGSEGSTGEGVCCDPEQAPICIEGSTCCSDGTWECNPGLGMAPCDEGTICGGGDGGDMCSGPQQSCAQGETCCEGLMCCAGVPIPPGQEYCGQNCPISDRNKKENFRAIDPHEVLRKVAAMPISTWNYKAEPPAVRHMGPMAQDFKATFGLGSTDKAIFTIDADGVALAAIQGLNTEVESLRKENQTLKDTLKTLQQRLDRLEQK